MTTFPLAPSFSRPVLSSHYLHHQPRHRPFLLARHRTVSSAPDVFSLGTVMKGIPLSP